MNVRFDSLSLTHQVASVSVWLLDCLVLLQYGSLVWYDFQLSFWGGKVGNQPCFEKYEMSSTVT